MRVYSRKGFVPHKQQRFHTRGGNGLHAEESSRWERAHYHIDGCGIAWSYRSDRRGDMAAYRLSLIPTGGFTEAKQG